MFKLREPKRLQVTIHRRVRWNYSNIYYGAVIHS